MFAVRTVPFDNNDIQRQCANLARGTAVIFVLFVFVLDNNSWGCTDKSIGYWYQYLYRVSVQVPLWSTVTIIGY